MVKFKVTCTVIAPEDIPRHYNFEEDTIERAILLASTFAKAVQNENPLFQINFKLEEVVYRETPIPHKFHDLLLNDR